MLLSIILLEPKQNSRISQRDRWQYVEENGYVNMYVCYLINWKVNLITENVIFSNAWAGIKNKLTLN